MSGEEKLRGYLRRVTAELLEARQRLAAASGTEPIAIVGMACRFPGGVRSPEDLWRLMESGGSGIGALPDNRDWDLTEFDTDETQPPTPRAGGFLHDAADFDADLFEISPREAVAMDPQHRLLLELAWESLERAGIPADALRGTPTGVYVGMIHNDYGTWLTGSAQATSAFGGFFLNGNSSAVASGRIAYALGLHGPAVTIDTACSSALVAIHDACHALRQGDCSTALVGGAAVMTTPRLLVEFSRQGGLAPDGRCKPFAAAADGTSFSEGVAMLVLERLSDAERSGHEVLAVVRGSALNQDGASNGLTAPNGMAQQQVIRQALANAGLTPDQVDAVEAHGTGTTLGDPIEGKALLATYGSRRAGGRPLLLGSVKSNLGHTQAAAGLAGVIKMVLSMRHGVLPASLHIDEPTPHIDWSAGQIQLLTTATPWPRTGEPRRAGISSFSFSGTNAHVILEQAPVAQEVPTEEPVRTLPALPWVLSAKTAPALRAQAGRLLAHLDAERATSDADIGLSLAAGRTVLRHRAVVIGHDRHAMRAGLAALAASEPAENLVQGAATGASAPGAVFVFPGQGSQWVGMARELIDAEPVFAGRAQECVEAFAPYLDWSLTDVLRGAPGARGLDDVEVVQTSLFTVMVSLAALWEARGVRPVAVVGHSQGELAAAVVAGALTLPDAARAVALRCRAIRSTLAGHGGMVSVALPVARVEQLLDHSRLFVAAVNGPGSTVVSGDPQALTALLDSCASDGVRAQRVLVDYSSHSPQVDAVETELRAVLAGIRPSDTRLPFYSAVTAGPLEGAELTGDYWFVNLRRRVNFVGAVDALLTDGHRTFVECSPHPVLALGIEELAEQRGFEVVVAGSLRRDDGGPARFLTSLAQLHVQGGRVEWDGIFAGTGAKRVPLPTYAFQHRRFWLDKPARAKGDVRAAGLIPMDHPLLGAAVELAGGAGAVFTGRLSMAEHGWVTDHAAGGTLLVPGTVCVELAGQVAARAGLGSVEELTIEVPMVVPDEGELALQVTAGDPDESGRRPFALYSRPAGVAVDAPWARHAGGVLRADLPEADPAAWSALRGAWPPVGAEPVDVSGVYDRLAGLGYQYGPAFQGLRGVWRRDGELFAEVALPDGVTPAGFGLHPALFDAAMHAVLVDRADGAPGEGRLSLPFAWHDVTVHRGGADALRVRLAYRDEDDVTMAAVDPSGAPVVSVGSLATRPVTLEQLRAARGALRDAWFRVDWPLATQTAGASVPPEFALLGDVAGVPAASRYADLKALAAALDAGEPAPDVVVTAAPPAVPGSATAQAVRAALDSTLALLRAWLADDRLQATRLAIVTRGAVAVDGDEAPRLDGAAVWGLVRSAQSEHPGRFLLIDTDGTPTSGAVVPTVFAGQEPQCVLRAGSVRVARLVRALAPTAEPGPVADGTVLITGGLGTVGAVVARHLVAERGARHLLLVGRRGADTPGADRLVAELTALGASVTVARCDVADRAAAARLLASLPAEHPLTTVVHAAGVVDDGLVDALTPDRLERVLRPKVDAAINLHELTRSDNLGEFILFSSLAGVLGGAGQANYAAANAFLDALAQHRRHLGLPGLSLAWGHWAQTSGLTGELAEKDLRRLAAAGIVPMPSEEALALLDAGRASDESAVVPARLDLAALRRAAGAGLLPSVLTSLVRAPAATYRPDGAAETSAGDAATWRRELVALPTEEQLVRLTDLVRSRVATVLGHPPAAAATIDADRAFKELGFDSLTAVELRNRLGVATGLRLPATLVFDHPTPSALATFLRAQLVGDEPDRAEGIDPVTAAVEHLRAVVAAQPPGDPGRAGLTARLRDLVRELDAGPQEPTVEVESASADELFDLLDEQFETF
ncbi:SDR family NAD(P)-dependent oxidoreductase [Micromonospora sp. WMMD736]|uniref:type I polyketide synthase n=1 Tax=Micromonospora sp. WMMD736 TaxID=3404112 RepID=UPI003B92897A